MPESTKAARQFWLCTAVSSAARRSWPGVRRMGKGFMAVILALGRIAGLSGLTAQEAQTAIANYEAAARRARPTASEPASQSDALLTHFMTVENDGSLAQRVRSAVTNNRGESGT